MWWLNRICSRQSMRKLLVVQTLMLTAACAKNSEGNFLTAAATVLTSTPTSLPSSTINACDLELVTVSKSDKLTGTTARQILRNDEKIVTACPELSASK